MESWLSDQIFANSTKPGHKEWKHKVTRFCTNSTKFNHRFDIELLNTVENEFNEEVVEIIREPKVSLSMHDMKVFLSVLISVLVYPSPCTNFDTFSSQY